MQLTELPQANIHSDHTNEPRYYIVQIEAHH